MRTWPLTEAVVVAVLALLLLVPLLRVTGRDIPNEAQTNEPASPNAAVPCWITVRSPHPLTSLQLAHEGTVLLKEANNTSFETSADLSIATTGIELAITATWAPGTPESVIEVTIEPDARDARISTVWGEETIDDILDFQWIHTHP